LHGVDGVAGGRDRDAERHGISPYSSLFCLDRAGRYHKAHFRQLNEIVLLPPSTQFVPGPIGRADNFAKTALSSVVFQQVDFLSRPEDDSLPGLDIAGYCPQSKRDIERIDAHGAPEGQFTELVLQ